MCIGCDWSRFRGLLNVDWPAFKVAPNERDDRRCGAVCAALLAVAAWGTPAQAMPSLVTAPDGTFQGKTDTTGAMLEFLGLRYAQPVTGSLRWKAPQPVRPSADTQDATRFGNHCPQIFSPFGNATETEDCLFLNVFVPNRRGDSDPDRNDAHPVMVWIHGGGLVVGESDEFNAIKLVQRGVIVVTINYRLGVLGFLAHPALTAESPDHTSGNFGIQDQQAALNWVRRNIRAFGGDPERVTIFGESAGGLSTLTNLASPTAQGLFHSAIVQSGTWYALEQPALAQAEVVGTNFAKAVGCNQPNPTDVLVCLRGLSVPTILANQALSFVRSFPFPNVDGKVLTQSIGPALASGQFNRVPLMNGTTRDEQNLFVAMDYDLAAGPITAATYLAAIAALTGTSTQAALVASRYPVPAQFPSFDQGAAAAATDAQDACTARFVDQLASSFVPTFAYEFNDQKAPQNFLPAVTFPYGAYHSAEDQYIFPVANPLGYGLNLAQTPLDADQQRLSDRMVDYWTEFARSGDPAGSGQSHWPRFHRDHQVWLSLVPPTPVTETNFATVHQCDFWDGLAGRILPPAHD